MGDAEVVELLKIANRHIPRVRLEYDGVIMEINSRKAELSSWKAATSNEVRLYQDFCNRNLKLKNREDELKLSINELEFKEADLQKKITNLNQHLSELDLSEREIDAENEHPDSGMEQEGDRLMDELSVIPPSNMTNDNHQDENKIGFYQSQVEPSSGTLIFDTKNLLLACSLFQEQQE
jgi:hypothetical protein